MGLKLPRIEVQKPPFKKGTLKPIIYRTGPIKAIVFFGIILTSFIASQCATSKKPANKQSIRRIDLLYQLPVGYDGSAIAYQSDSISIFYLDTLEIYRFPAYMTKIIDDSVINVGIQFCYFLRVKSDSVGYWQSQWVDSSLSMVKSDSILNARAFQSFRLAKDDSKILVRRLKLSFSKLALEYVRNQKSEGYTSDSIHLVFDKFISRFPYTFSPYYEKLENAKLIKVQLITNQQGSPNSQAFIPKRVLTLELKEKSVTDTGELLGVIQRFRRLKYQH